MTAKPIANGGHALRVPPALARRIDRLAVRAHRFHRWAHHPLCARYADETLRLGRKAVVCRGCALVASGLVAGMLLCAVLEGVPLGLRWESPGGSWAVVASAAAALRLLTRSRAGSHTQRLSKLWTRFVPALLAGGWATHALLERSLRGALGLALLGVGTATLVVLYRRRGPNRTACLHCPERLASGPCSGIRPILRRERAFRRLAQRWLSVPS